MFICPECNKQVNEVCDECGVCLDVPKLEVFDIYNYMPRHTHCYKTLTHFREILNNWQGRELKAIPDNVYDRIKQATNNKLEILDEQNLKIILKHLKLTKFIENCNSILFTLTGKQPPYLRKEIELKLIRYFKQIAKIYEEFRPTNRTYFLNYYYVLYKLLELMNEDELLSKIPLIRSKHRINQHDRIWQCVCYSLNWQFIKTKVK